MVLNEELFNQVLQDIFGDNRIVYQGETIDFTPPWPRITLYDALRETAGADETVLADLESATRFAKTHGIDISRRDNLGKVLTKIFDQLVEPKLIQPTFVIGYPTEISPLSRRNEENPEITDRFELFIGGKEIANGFNELNDPDDQRERFMMQVSLREAGDEEALFMDEDYVTALEHGLCPTAGEGIGIDRVVMLMTDAPSIRDVVFFPQMRTKHAF
jgi:lysyl-tRNA synthetase class 2